MKLRIVQLTDCHVTSDPEFELKSVRTRDTLLSVLKLARERYAEAARLVVTGDLTHDEQLSTYEILRDILAPWSSLLRVIPGNHDDRAAMARVFAAQINSAAGRNTFVDVIEKWKLIGLDTHEPGAVHGTLGNDQLHWLERQLSAAPGQPTALFMHHPPMKMHIPWLDEILLVDGREFLELVKRHAQIRLIACGHVHMERTAVVGSTTIVTSPATGVQFRPDTETLVIDGAGPGLRIIDLHDSGEVSTWVERVIPG